MITELVTHILPSYYAGALINGDWDNLNPEEVKELKDFLITNKLGTCLACSENEYFAWRNDMNSIGNTVLEFTFVPLNSSEITTEKVWQIFSRFSFEEQEYMLKTAGVLPHNDPKERLHQLLIVWFHGAIPNLEKLKELKYGKN